MYKLLLVDDEPDILNGMVNGIQWNDWGFEVIGKAHNGIEALEVIKNEKPHVVLSDIRMPKMDGVELMKYLNQNYPEIKIIISSGYNDVEYLTVSIKSSVAEYLLKPTDIDELEEVFSKIKQKLDEEIKQKNELENLKKIVGVLKEEGGEESQSNLGRVVKKYVDEEYSSNLISLEFIAEKVKKSPAYLSKLFKKETGYNFSDYVTIKRLELGKELLKDPSLKVYEISEKIGYADVSNFIKVFKKNYGISPNEYRNLQGGSDGF